MLTFPKRERHVHGAAFVGGRRQWPSMADWEVTRSIDARSNNNFDDGLDLQNIEYSSRRLCLRISLATFSSQASYKPDKLAIFNLRPDGHNELLVS